MGKGRGRKEQGEEGGEGNYTKVLIKEKEVGRRIRRTAGKLGQWRGVSWAF